MLRSLHSLRRVRLLAVALVPLALAACDDTDKDTATGPFNNATVRLLNATNTSLTVSNAGVVATGNNNINFGAGSSCMAVNTSGQTGTGLTFTQAGTTTPISFTPSFASGGNYTVVAYTNAAGGAQFAIIDNTGFTPAVGQAGLRVVNASSGTASLFPTSGATPLGASTGIASGTAGTFVSLAANNPSVTVNTGAGTSNIATAGPLTLVPGQNYTLVIGSPAAGSTSLRTFMLPTC
jgi:hypothetical protein